MVSQLLKPRAIMLFSGGLDSMLAVKLLQKQGLEVLGLCFFSNFFSCQQARQSAQQIGISLVTIDISAEMLAVVKNPPSGYGRYLNPCLDCHALMFKRAAQFAQQQKIAVLASGEVLGQRPFSQNRQAFKKITKLSGTEILRPLSAKLLPSTTAEKTGLVKRELLFGLSGRRRDQQIKLALKFGFKSYPSPAGGCLLTEKDFSQRLKQMFSFWPNCQPADVELLKYGRIFWFQIRGQKPALAIIGRNHQDNQALEKMLQKQDYVLQLKKRPGPTALLRGCCQNLAVKPELNILSPQKLKIKPQEIIILDSKEDIFSLLAQLTAFYAPATRGQQVKVIVKQGKI